MQNNLRPQKFQEFIGQKRLISTLKILLTSARKQKKTLDHILFYGKAGYGKTSLASVIANENNTKIHFAQGPLLEKKSDIITLFGSITKGDVIFIDEIHGINNSIEELLYSAIEDFAIDIAVGPEGDQRIVRIKIPHFTLIGATTKQGKISKPLKDRFGLIAKLSNYDYDDISKIILQSAKKLKIKIDESNTMIISKYSKANPRIGNNLLKRVIDFSIAKDQAISKKLIEKTFNSIGIYKYGINDLHIQYLKVLNDTFYEKFVSIETISGILQEEKVFLENEVEIDLLENMLIEKSSRGRKITTKGIYFITNFLSKLS